MINYYLLTKPGIIMGNLLTLGAGFLLAADGVIDFGLMGSAFIGLALIMASGCVFNNYIDLPLDKKMKRTQNRPLVTGLISGKRALIFGAVLGILGNVILFFWTNTLALVVADIGFLVYVVLYSLWKRHTVYGTAIGSVAGATPPLVGYCAVANQIDVGAIVLFAILVLWQMPHFFSIAVYRLEDYRAAGIPVLPLEKGMWRTKMHMAVYIALFTIACALLTLFHYTGYLYLIVATLLGVIWLVYSLKGFKQRDDHLWSRSCFRFSLIVITTLCLVIPFDLVP